VDLWVDTGRFVPKCWYVPTNPHGVTVHKTKIDIITTMRTSKLMKITCAEFFHFHRKYWTHNWRVKIPGLNQIHEETNRIMGKFKCTQLMQEIIKTNYDAKSGYETTLRHLEVNYSECHVVQEFTSYQTASWGREDGNIWLYGQQTSSVRLMALNRFYDTSYACKSRFQSLTAKNVFQ
jgi:hypothetical protein